MKTAHRILSFLGLLVMSPCAAQDANALSEVPRRDEYLRQMAPLISRSVQRTDTGHPLFHGCIDWHSAVHGNWALCRVSRVLGDLRWSAAVADSFTPDAIGRERDDLQRNPRFEMPYGRAWFLLLATEVELCAADANWVDAKRLRPMADEVAQSLLAFYSRRAPDPNSLEYANASWALARLHAYAAHTQNSELAQRTASLVQSSMLTPATVPSFRDDASRGEFFSRFGNWAYLMVKTQDAPAVARFFQQYPLADEALRPVALLPTAHHLGMNWSRAWALRAMSRAATDELARNRLHQAYLAHIEAAMTSHAAHAADYGAYGHWVPQFAVYALTE